MQKLTVFMVFMLVVVNCYGDQLSAQDKPQDLTDEESPAVHELDLESIDPLIRPQDDFYKYSNGIWLENNKATLKERYKGTFAEVNQLAEDNVALLIKDAANTMSDTTEPTHNVIGALYQSYMDIEALEAKGLTGLTQDLEKIAAIKTEADVINFIAAKVPEGAAYLFEVTVGRDQGDRSMNVAYLSPKQLNIGMYDYTTHDAKRKMEYSIEKYSTYVEKLQKLAGIDDAKENTEEIIEIETELVSFNKKIDYKQRQKDPEYYYKNFYFPHTPDEIAAWKGEINWRNVLTILGLENAEKIIVTDPGYFKKLSKYIDDISVGDWKMYLTFLTIDNAIPYLPEAYQKQYYRNALFYPRWKMEKKREKREEHAVSFVNHHLSELVGQLYVENSFSPEQKGAIKALTENILQATTNVIDDFEWMSASTKTNAKDKLTKINFKIGYPDEGGFADYSGLELSSENLHGNMLALKQYRYAKDIEKIGNPVERKTWQKAPQWVQARYNVSDNDIVLSAAFLQPPMYDQQMTPLVLYARIGSVIGHEIGHALFGPASFYDGDGNKANWWAEEDRAYIEKQNNKLIELYGNFQIRSGIYVQGKDTLNENIADLFGLKVAFEAFKLVNKDTSLAFDNGYSWQQRFFIAHAQSWQEKLMSYTQTRMAFNDEHSPSRFRVVGVMMNLPDFYDAFEVESTDKQYLAPEKRVALW
ncbi:M13 family metallopeptidase [Thalassotalea sp. LPB0316]|uniref:M13-type metalloendopeptidase n=1 Tax=Thalassotalea sp. LPB0316 TaxID=2769490 RepID=UPI00186770E7|nr:M13 family metallopeptidase [Thalassotalea sp. LPB0316]QOL25260.1 M13 family metallopeptidase [Thalassotalea sp. LPB0316]